MATCSTIYGQNVDIAKSKIASYIIYYTTGNSNGSCACKSRCNNQGEQSKLYPLIQDTVGRNSSLLSQFRTIACNIQLHGNASQIEQQCRDMARAILQINNTPADAKCKSGGGSTGGGDPFKQLQVWLSQSTSGIPNFVIVAGVGVLALLFLSRR